MKRGCGKPSHETGSNTGNLTGLQSAQDGVAKESRPKAGGCDKPGRSQAGRAPSRELDPQVRPRPQQLVGQLRAGCNQALTVIQHQEQMPLPHKVADHFFKRAIGSFPACSTVAIDCKTRFGSGKGERSTTHTPSLNP